MICICAFVLRFAVRLQYSLEQIVGYRHLMNEVESVRRIPYSTEDPAHEAKLLMVHTFFVGKMGQHARKVIDLEDSGCFLVECEVYEPKDKFGNGFRPECQNRCSPSTVF